MVGMIIHRESLTGHGKISSNLRGNRRSRLVINAATLESSVHTAPIVLEKDARGIERLALDLKGWEAWETSLPSVSVRWHEWVLSTGLSRP